MHFLLKFTLLMSFFFQNVPINYGGVCQCTCSNQGARSGGNTGRANDKADDDDDDDGDDDDDDDGWVPPPGAERVRVYADQPESRATNSIKESVAALIKYATEKGAPFVKEALQKLNGEIFGSARAFRSTDVALFNVANADWELSEEYCKRGGWTSQGDFLPPHNVLKKTSNVYGGQSHGFLTGVNCYVVYKAAGGKMIHLKFSNPFTNPSYAEATATGVRVTPQNTKGSNAIISFTVQDI